MLLCPCQVPSGNAIWEKQHILKRQRKGLGLSLSGLDQVLSSIPSTQSVEAEGSEVQDHPQLQSNFEASLGYMRPQFKKRVSVVAGE